MKTELVSKKIIELKIRSDLVKLNVVILDEHTRKIIYKECISSKKRKEKNELNEFCDRLNLLVASFYYKHYKRRKYA